MHRDLAPTRRFSPRQAEHEHFFFEGLDYPLTRDELVDYASDASEDVDILNLIRSLPDREYLDRNDVWRAMGEATRRFGLGREDGQSRDDIGKSWTVVEDGVRHP